MKHLFHFLLIGAALFLTGCIAPPRSITTTPAVSGRVVDSVTGLPIEHATISFVQNNRRPPLDARAVTTDSTGCFAFDNISHIMAGFAWSPMNGGYFLLNDRPESTGVLIERTGYGSKIVDFRAAYYRLREHEHTIPLSEPYELSHYKGLLPLGDIPLVKSPAPAP